MADVQDAAPASEPSMEEILASIRKIIADEKDPAETNEPAPAAPESEDVLELTQMVQDDGSIMDLANPVVPPAEDIPPPPPPPPPPVFEPEPMPEPEPVFSPPPPPPPPPEMSDDALLSMAAETATSSALAALATSVHRPPAGSLAVSRAGVTLEDMVKEMLRPLLKEWLDQNLPPIVDRIVQKEVERISRRVQE